MLNIEIWNYRELINRIYILVDIKIIINWVND